jgi:hypothetical protein
VVVLSPQIHAWRAANVALATEVESVGHRTGMYRLR